MKTEYCRINFEGEFQVRLEAETQEEAALLFEATQRFPSSIKAFGKVDTHATWAWVNIPLRRLPFAKNYFGNDRKPK